LLCVFTPLCLFVGSAFVDPLVLLHYFTVTIFCWVYKLSLLLPIGVCTMYCAGVYDWCA